MTMSNNRRGLDDGGNSVWRRVNARLLPPLFAVALCCQLDRSNLAFAALQMDGDLGFSRTVHGIGSGLFFIGYLAQVPANMLCVALGPTRWLPILLVCWGAVAMCFAAISGTASFLVLRLLLGVAEAGAYPAIMYLLSLFYPPRMLGMAYTTVATATAVAGLLGAPLAAALTLLDGVGGLRGWQAMFLAEGLLPILLAAALPFLLPSSPLTARFLAPAEQQWLWQQVHGCRDVELVATPAGAEAAAMVASTEPSMSPAHEGHAADDTLLPREQGGAVHDRAADVERASHSNVEHAALLDPAQAASDESGASQHAKADGWEPGSHSSSSWAALRVGLSDSRIWHLACAMLLIDLTMNSINFFLPSLVRAALLGELQEDASPDSSSTESTEHGASSSTALLIKSSLLSALPFCGAAVCMVGNAWHAQRADERRLHTVAPMCFAALGLAATPLLSALGPGFALAALTLAASGIWATHGPFFSWPSALLDHKAAAIGFALVKTGGAVGGFLGPFGVGALADAFHGYTAAMLMLAGVALAAGALVLAFRDRR